MEKVNDIRRLIQGEIKKAYGQEVLYAKDCQVLSISIRQKTNRSLSVSTLKRLFGIVKSPYLPSKYTLDTIALFVNYRNWSEMENTISTGQSETAGISQWSYLKSRIEIVTKHSLSSIRAKLSHQLLDFQPREFAISRFEKFLQSPYTATAFIAPGGYGKTTMTTQLTELFFTGPDARYPDDIVCLIDGSILVNLMNLNQEIIRLKGLLDFEGRDSFATYFITHPEHVKGRFVLIIESIYQIYYQGERLLNFIENLMDILSFYKDISWFKCLITCRPDNWKLLSNQIQTRSDFKHSWFDVIFEGSSVDYINVPLLSTEEIDYFLRRRHSRKSFEKFKFLYADMKDLLRMPYLLNLFSSIESPESMHSDLEILETYFSKNILIEPYLEEKHAILDHIIKRSDYARHTSAVRKSDLPLSGTYKLAYDALIFHNVIYDYSVPGSRLSVETYVRFSNDILMGYVLANAWLKEHTFDLRLITEIFHFYDANLPFRSNVLKFLIKIAFKERNTGVLSRILSVVLEDKAADEAMPGDHSLYELLTTIGLELRRDKKTRDILVPYFARSDAGQFFYFERFFDMDSLVLHSGNYLDLYMAHKHTGDANIRAHYFKFMQYFLLNDAVHCKRIHDALQAQGIQEQHAMTTMAYYLSVQIMYHSFEQKELAPHLLQRIRDASDLVLNNVRHPGAYATVFGQFIFVALHFGDNFSEITDLYERALKMSADNANSQSWESQLCRIIYARALLNTGNIKRANEITKGEEKLSVPYHSQNYVSILQMFIQLDFLIHDHQLEEASHILLKIKTVSQVLKFKYFYKKAVHYERTISPVS